MTINFVTEHTDVERHKILWYTQRSVRDVLSLNFIAWNNGEGSKE